MYTRSLRGGEALRIGVFGAGAIGGFLGILLSSAGAAVTLVGRRSLVDARPRLSAVLHDGRAASPSPSLDVHEEAEALADVDVVLVTVKSQATGEAAEALAAAVPEGTPIVSFQNGLGNAAALRERLGPRVVPGMVSFNVIREEDGARFRQTTIGPLIAGCGEPSQAPLMEALSRTFADAGLPLDVHADIEPVLAGKLLLNLNNGVCAATGLPLVASLRSQAARWCFARCMREGLAAMRRAGLRPRNVIGMPPGLIARFLPLPNFVVLPLARKLVAADPSARSSTLQDLEAGKTTEIGYLNGAIVELAARHGVPAPANAVITETVRQLEGGPRPLVFPTPEELRARIGAASA